MPVFNIYINIRSIHPSFSKGRYRLIKLKILIMIMDLPKYWIVYDCKGEGGGGGKP